MPQFNCSWQYSTVPTPNGVVRTKVDIFTIQHPEQPGQNYTVVATGTLEFPDPVLAKLMVDALAQAIDQKILVVPAQFLPSVQERN